MSRCGLGDRGLCALARGLRGNRHLAALRCGGNGALGARAAAELLAAVRACPSLRTLRADERVRRPATDEAAAVAAARP